jgi:16S rRNA (guanine966-N2)-methyltransferase
MYLAKWDIAQRSLVNKRSTPVGDVRNKYATIRGVRVIGGVFRSRPLKAPRGLATRPTTDRLRETLFNVLAPKIQQAVFADLYAGSGAVGIEALSRGAAFVYFVEQSKSAVQILKDNLRTLSIHANLQVEARSVRSFLISKPRSLDILFLDPPYETESEYTMALNQLGVMKEGLLSQEAIVVAEHRRKQPLKERYGDLQRYRVLEQGDAALSFFAVQIQDDREFSL